MMPSLLDILADKTPLTDVELAQVLSFWNVHKKLKKNELLIEAGEVEEHLYFVLSGTLRLYWEKGQEEICFNFGYPNTFIAAYPSFVKQQPSDHFIRAISPCELIGINRTGFDYIVNHIASVERAWRIFTEEALLERMERERQMLMLTPEERLVNCLEKSPQLFQHIPQKYLASYLGMKPETLSRMKRSFAEREKKKSDNG